MKLAIEATDQVLRVDGVECRVWKGVDEKGQECLVLVHRIAVSVDGDTAPFAAQLREVMEPLDVWGPLP